MKCCCRSMRLWIIACAVGIGFGGVLSLMPGCKDDAAAGKIRLAVIPKGTTHEFWKTVQAGAEQAGKEHGVEIIWKGPLKEDDRAAQIQVVEQFVSEGVNGIVLAPLDKDALSRPVKAAMGQKISVVIFDSALTGTAPADFVSLVATDNRRGGELAGERLAKLLDGKGKVVLIRYQEGSASTEEREAGFLSVMAKHPEIEIISKDRYAGATSDSAKTNALNMMDVLRQAEGIFIPNESSTLGTLLAMEQAGLVGGGVERKVKIVGFDTSDPLLARLEQSQLDGLVAQNPFKMGYDAVTTMVKHLRGEKVEAVYDTGVHMITKENLNDPEIKKLLRK